MLVKYIHIFVDKQVREGVYALKVTFIILKNYIHTEVDKMGIERINGATSLSVSSVSSANRSTSPRNMDIHVADVPVERHQKIDNVTVNSSRNNGSGYNRDYEDDMAEIQGSQDVPKEKIMAAVNDLNRQVKQNSVIKHTQLSFKYHDETNRIAITVTDCDTHEVIREIPPEKALDMLAKAWEMAGLLVDEKR